MRTVEELPHPIEEEPHVRIPMSDGTTLSARIWKPVSTGPVPAILEYIPYRKRFGTTDKDVLTHPYLAGHGYAAVRVDLRGSGESEGVLTDEYLPTELGDGVEVIEWIAQQPWCDGNVGMMGISWGGFNSLQVAALQPPSLKAIVTCCSTDDRYADDIHYMGGSLLLEHLSWASVMFSFNTMPPDKELVGEGWRDEWMKRLGESGLWLEKWLSHQRRDAYWKHGSVCEDYSDITVPVYAVSGWADSYSNAVFRLLANLDSPAKALVGPWRHVYPHMGSPGPAIGFLQELLRWWDQWLKGEDTGIMEEPALRLWMQDSAPPSTDYEHRPGRWIAEDTWPTPRTREVALHLDPRGRLETEAADGSVEISSPLWVGRFSGKWCSYSGPDLPGDQRHDDAGAQTFDTAPLEEPVEILGPPVVELNLMSDRPVAQVVARLCDVQPNGLATRVTYGVLNLTHRDSHEQPEPLEPEHQYQVTLQMNDVAQRFPTGNRIRLALSTSYWPHVWPAPEPVTLQLDCAESSLRLPTRPGRTEDQQLPPFGEAEGASALEITTHDPHRQSWTLDHDLGTDVHSLTVVDDAGLRTHHDTGLEVGRSTIEHYRIEEGKPCSATGEVETERSLRRDDWSIRTVTRTRLTSTVEHFCIEADLEAFEGSEVAYKRDWKLRIPRDHM